MTLGTGGARCGAVLVTAVSLLGGAALVGCTSKSHPPFAESGDTGGRRGVSFGGDPGASGDGGSGNDANGGADNGSGAAPTTTGPLDPSGVFIVAPLLKDTNPQAFAPIDKPNAYTYGMCRDCYGAQFRGGALVYADEGQPLHLFVPDLAGSPPPKDYQYPPSMANDAVVATPACSPGPVSFLTGPEGQLVYRCELNGPWYQGAGKIYEGKQNFIALGAGSLVLVDDEDTDAMTHAYGILDLNDGHVTPVPDLGAFDSYAQRWNANGFHVVIESPEGELLYEAHVDGSAKRLGIFTEAPGYIGSITVLTPDDHGIALGYVGNSGVEGNTFAIDRTTLNGGTERLYSVFRDDSWLFLAYSSLITGR